MSSSKLKFSYKNYWDLPVFPLLFLKLFRAQNYFDKCEGGGQLVSTKGSLHHIKNTLENFKEEPGGNDIIKFAHLRKNQRFFSFNHRRL